MYIGKEAFTPAPDRERARKLFACSVERVEVETHSYCNRRCDYCPNASGDRLEENRRMPDAVWFRLLDNLQEIDYGSNFVFTSYNEPLADRVILERVREARTRLPKARLMIYTNGDYLDGAYLEALQQAGLDYLHVSIHMRPGSRYDDVTALNDITAVAARIGRQVQYQGMQSGAGILARIPHTSPEIEIRAINYWQHGTNRGGLLSGFSAPVRTMPCHFPFSHFHMGFDGTVVPCCHIRSDSPEHRSYRYGNLQDADSIFELFAGTAATRWRRQLISFEPKTGPCRHCTVGFLSQDPGTLERIRKAWETHADGARAAGT